MSQQIINHSRIPVVVVPLVACVHASPDALPPMVVGVDGSANSRAALHWAARRAQVTGSTIRAAYVWGQSPSLEPDDDYSDWGLPSPTELTAAAAGELEEYLAAAALPPDVRVAPVLLEGDRASALTRESHSAGLLVVGARGHGGLADRLIGSTTAAVVRQAPCPVVIVRPDPSGDDLEDR